MAKRAKDVKPLFAVKHEFMDSLNRLAEESIMFLQVIETALELGQIGERVKPIVGERAKAFRAALTSDE